MRGWIGMAIVVWAPLQVACTQLSSKKLPAVPPAMAVSADSFDGNWWTAGDAACPSTEVKRTTSGPPGANIVAGRLYGAAPPGGDRIWCAVGVDHGMSTTFHSSGARATQGEYVFGVKTGAWIAWHANGQMESRGNYTGGKQTGVWEYWSETGALARRGELDDTTQTGMWIYWSADASIGDDAQRWIAHDDKGRPTRRGVFRGDKLVETHTVCVMGVALPECQLIALADLTVRATPNAEATSAESGNSKLSYPFEMGGVYNLASAHGVGLTVGYNFGDEYSGWAVRGRYRFWMTRHLGLDVGYGAIWARGGLDGAAERGSAGFIALSGADLVSLVVEVQRYDAGDGIEYATHFGLRIGGPVIATLLYVAARLGAH